MFKLLRYLLVIIVLAVMGVLGYATLQPNDFRYSRSIEISAPEAKIATLVTDFKRFGEWSPWEKLDPAMKRNYSGAPTGVGAVYEWDGNDEVGAGRQEIVKVEPGLVTMKLDFKRPYEANNMTDFQFEPAGQGTKVTWSIYGPNPMISKIMGLFMDIEAMVGGDFEKGLASLKELAEKQ